MKRYEKGRKLKRVLCASTAMAFASTGLALAADCFDGEGDAEKAGAATAVIGPAVGVRRGDQVDFGRPEAGDDVFTGDRVRTGDDSHLQLKLCDWSTYTFSPNSETDIAEFYDAETAERRRIVNFVRGGFRMASGRNTEPGSTEVEFEEAGVTMGVRGTSVLIVELDGEIYVVLEGPGLDNNGLEPRGRVEFWTDGVRENVVTYLSRPGYALRIGPDGLSEPFRADSALLQRIYAAFVPVVPDADDADVADVTGAATTSSSNGSGVGAGADESGQSTQNGADIIIVADANATIGDNTTDNNPNEPAQPGGGGAGAPDVGDPGAGDPGTGDPDDPNDPQDPSDPPDPIDPSDPVDPPDPIDPPQIGDILTLGELNDFVDGVTGTVSFSALIPALSVTTTGAPNPTDNGTEVQESLIQIEVDYDSRTIAPNALTTFLSADGPEGGEDDPIFDQFVTDLLTDVNIAFGNLTDPNADAIIASQSGLYTFTFRQGADDSITLDVSISFSGSDQQTGESVTATGLVQDLIAQAGPGQFTYFGVALEKVFADTEIQNGFEAAEAEHLNRQAPTQTVLAGVNDFTVQADGIGVVQRGLSYGQLAIDLSTGAVGDSGSFVAFMSPDSSGGPRPLVLPLPNAIDAFNPANWAFGRAIFPLDMLTDSGSGLIAGQLLLGGEAQFGPFELGGDIALILNDNGDRRYSEIELFDTFGPGVQAPAAPSSLRLPLLSDAQIPTLGESLFNGFGTAEIDATNRVGVTSAVIAIDFAARTIGGLQQSGEASQVSIQFDDTFGSISIIETVPETGFAATKADDWAAFGLGAADFSGNDIQAAMILLRDNGVSIAGDLFVSFDDGVNGAGSAEVNNVVLPGVSPNSP